MLPNLITHIYNKSICKYARIEEVVIKIEAKTLKFFNNKHYIKVLNITKKINEKLEERVLYINTLFLYIQIIVYVYNYIFIA